MNELLTVVVAVCLGYLLLSNAVYVALVLIGAVENGVRRRESGMHDYETLASSRFTIPVSVVLSAYDEEPTIVSAVE